MERHDVIILGGGLVGLTLAVALDAHGLTSVVVDPADPAALAAPGHDGRASAVASASWAMLEAIGVAPRLAGEGCDIRAIRVSEGLAPRGLVFAPPEGDRPLGTMFANRTLRRVLHEAAVDAPGVTLAMPLRPRRDAARRRRGAGHAGRRPRARGTAADRRGGAQLADARRGGDQGRALALRPCRDHRHHRPRAAAWLNRLRDLLQ